MFPDDDVKLRGAGRAAATATKASGTERDSGGVVAVRGQRGTLYDSFELNAMVVRLNRLLNGDGAGAGGRGVARQRPRRAAGSWLAAPRSLFRKLKGAFRRGDT
jgi:hypothetical protein